MFYGALQSIQQCFPGPRRAGRCLSTLLCFGCVALLAVVRVASAGAATDSGITPLESIALPLGHGVYFFVGSTSGEQQIGSISWLEGQDLVVFAVGSGARAISIGHTSANTGSYASTAASEATAGVGLDGYTVVRAFSVQTKKAAHRAVRPPERPVTGPRVTLSFTTTAANQRVVILAGGQGTGTLTLSGIEAATLQNATYGPAHSPVIASAAAYSTQLPVGKYKAKLQSTSYAPNSGTGLGAVAYVLAPAPAPAVTSVSPNAGPEAGGTTVSITGSNLDGATSVKFGATDAQSFKVNSPTSIEAVSPSGTGTTEVTVTTERGTSTASPADQFSFVPPPAVTSVSPNTGPEPGGTLVTITGTNLAGTTTVKFGSTNALSFKVNSSTSIEAVSPSGTGTTDVTAANAYGTSATSSSDQFSYLPPHPVNAYANYGPAAAGHAMCRGNPGRPESMPGGTATQTFAVPIGVASLSSALVQIDPDSTVAAHLTLTINGVVRATATSTAGGDTSFSWPAVVTNPGDQVSLSISFTATFGKIITIYSAAAVGGALSYSNSCSDGAPSGSTENGLRAIVSGLSF